MMWQDLLTAVALMLVLEGVLPFLNPSGLRTALFQIIHLNDRSLRAVGLFSMLAGVVLLYFVH